MASQKKRFRQIHLVYKRTPASVKIALLAVIVLSTVALLVLRGELLKKQEELEASRRYAQQLEQENEKQQQLINQQGTIDGIDDAANNEGLVDKDTIFIQVENQNDYYGQNNQTNEQMRILVEIVLPVLGVCFAVALLMLLRKSSKKQKEREFSQ